LAGWRCRDQSPFDHRRVWDVERATQRHDPGSIWRHGEQCHPRLRGWGGRHHPALGREHLAVDSDFNRANLRAIARASALRWTCGWWATAGRSSVGRPDRPPMRGALALLEEVGLLSMLSGVGA
jgi:hypothetical protein